MKNQKAKKIIIKNQRAQYKTRRAQTVEADLIGFDDCPPDDYGPDHWLDDVLSGRRTLINSWPTIEAPDQSNSRAFWPFVETGI